MMGEEQTGVRSWNLLEELSPISAILLPHPQSVNSRSRDSEMMALILVFKPKMQKGFLVMFVSELGPLAALTS